jgi:hypothetical protein
VISKNNNKAFGLREKLHPHGRIVKLNYCDFSVIKAARNEELFRVLGAAQM